MVRAQTPQPPRRMVGARHLVVLRGRDQRIALTQKTAQAGVDETGLRARAGGRRQALMKPACARVLALRRAASTA